MSEKRPDLRVISADGELLDECPECVELKGQVTGLERDIRAWRARYANLARDKEADAMRSPLWDDAVEVFDYWRVKCNHPASRFNADRFHLIEPFLREYGKALCRKAIDGAAFDAFATKRRNGTEKRHDGWELIHRDRGKWEEFCNRAPRADG